jgi:hypothetical protein
MALRSSQMQFAAGIGRGLRSDRATAARALVSLFQGLRARPRRGDGALVGLLTVCSWRTPLILHDPVALPMSSATMPSMSTPLAIQWPWPRCVLVR